MNNRRRSLLFLTTATERYRGDTPESNRVRKKIITRERLRKKEGGEVLAAGATIFEGGNQLSWFSHRETLREAFTLSKTSEASGTGGQILRSERGGTLVTVIRGVKDTLGLSRPRERQMHVWQVDSSYHDPDSRSQLPGRRLA